MVLLKAIVFSSSKKMGGISNFQIEDAMKKIGDEDLLDNFVGVFPSNYMRKSGKRENTRLLLRTQMRVTKKERIGGAF